MAKNLHSYKTKLTFDATAVLAECLQTCVNLRLARAMAALRAGILAHMVKDNLAHGDFQKWLTKSDSLSHFSFRSIQRKMRLANAFRADVAISAEKLERSGFVQANNDADELTQQARKWIGDRSLHQLYQDYGVVKAETSGGQHNGQTKTPAELQQMEFEQLRESVKQASSTLFAHLKTGTLGKLPSADRWGLVEAVVPAVEFIALNTSDLTPKQLRELQDKLRSISGEITERLGAKAA